MAKVKMVKRDVEVETEVETAPKVVPMKKKTALAAVPTPAPKAEKVATPSRFKGATTGLRVMEFQDKTLRDNVKLKLTDEQLAESWRKEFPGAKPATPALVRLVRKLYNAGTHSKAYAAPEKPSVEYDAEGNKLAAPKAKAPKVEEPVVVETPKKSKKR